MKEYAVLGHVQAAGEADDEGIRNRVDNPFGLNIPSGKH